METQPRSGRRWMTPKQAADYIGVAQDTIYTWINLKEDFLPSYQPGGRIILIDQDALDEWIFNHPTGQARARDGPIRVR